MHTLIFSPAVRVLLLCGLLGCGSSGECLKQLESHATAYIAAIDALDRSCSVDADCVLVAPDLPCVLMCKRPLKATEVTQFTELQSSFASRCPDCKAAIDCVKPPETVRCQAGVCMGE